MIEKLKTLFNTYYPYIYELRDIRIAGLILFGIVVLLISWSGVKSIETNYQLQKQISQLEQENKVIELDNANMQLQNDYYKTNQYLELSAKQNLGLAVPGETELIVSKAAALRNTKEMPKDKVALETEKRKESGIQKNYRSWINFFLHRQQQS